MPSDDALIAARLGMSSKTLAKHKAVLLRGWWLAEDGRLYQDTIVERVLEMLAKRDADRKRKADYRARQDSKGVDKSSNSVPHVSHGTDTGRTVDSTVSDATSTSTSTSTSNGIPPVVVNPKTSVCVKSAHTQISDEFRTAIRTARPELDADLVFANFVAHYPADKQTLAKWRQWVKNERAGVADAAAAAEQGDRNSRKGVEARAIAVGLPKWDEAEQWHLYRGRVERAEGVAA